MPRDTAMSLHVRWEATFVLRFQSSHASCSSTFCDENDKRNELRYFI